MKQIKVDASAFPLTHKWLRLIYKFSHLKAFEINDGIQEALILEYDLRRLLKSKWRNKAYRENYFKLVLRRKLCKYGVDSFRERTEPLQDDVVYEKTGTSNCITVRPFNDIYCGELKVSVAKMLMAQDALASEIFAHQCVMQTKWKEIKQAHFAEVSHSRFYNSVSFVKEVCLEYVKRASYGKGLLMTC